MSKALLRRVVTGFAVLGLSSAVYAFVIDPLVHVPANYNTFVPPPAGWTYTDPAFGTIVKRVSSAMTTSNNSGGGGMLEFISTEYSTMSPFNKDNTRFILQHQGYFGLYDAAGIYLKDLPMAVNASSEPRWSRTSPSLLFYRNGGDLLKLDVNTNLTTLVRSFPYSTISGKGESDISFDGDHFVFAGDDRYVFVYQISTDTTFPAFDTAGQPFDSLYITPNNSVTITWLQTGTGLRTGIELFNKNMVFQRQVAHAGGHMDVSKDTNGDEILLWTNSNDAQPIPNCDNGIVKIKLATAQQTCLLQLDWSIAVHISAPDGNGWVFVETYGGDPQPGTPAWKPYTNEILQVKLDGTQTRRLFHHRSRPSNDYGYMPRVASSRDGTKLAFTSNMGMPSILGWPADYTDAYMLTVSPF